MVHFLFLITLQAPQLLWLTPESYAVRQATPLEIHHYDSHDTPVVFKVEDPSLADHELVGAEKERVYLKGKGSILVVLELNGERRDMPIPAMKTLAQVTRFGDQFVLREDMVMSEKDHYFVLVNSAGQPLSEWVPGLPILEFFAKSDIPTSFHSSRFSGVYYKKSGRLFTKGNQGHQTIDRAELLALSSGITPENVFPGKDTLFLLKLLPEAAYVFALKGDKWEQVGTIAGAFASGIVLEQKVVLIGRDGQFRRSKY